MDRFPGQYRYCEGLAWSDEVGCPIHHAWGIDMETRVVEVAWDQPSKEYFGVVFSFRYVCRIISAERQFGIYTAAVCRLVKGQDQVAEALEETPAREAEGPVIK